MCYDFIKEIKYVFLIRIRHQLSKDKQIKSISEHYVLVHVSKTRLYVPRYLKAVLVSSR